MTVGVLVRKSTATEGKSRSRDEQLEQGRHYAELFGFREVIVYMEEEGQKGDWFWQDDDVQYPTPHCPQLSRMVRDIKAGRIQAVWVYKVDRLVRDVGVGDALAKLFKKYGIYYLVGARDVEIDTARGLYQTSLDSAAARQWRDQISEDIQRDHEFKARAGMFSRDPSCLGFRSKGRGSQQVEPVAEELFLVKRIFDLYVHGDRDKPLTVKGIANLLMDEGVRVAVGAKGHKAKKPGTIHDSQIRTILTNCMYVGRWRHKGTEYRCDRLLIDDPLQPGSKTTAVPLALYEAAQEKLAQTPSRVSKSVCSEHALTGLVVCGACGRPMHLNMKKRSDGSVRRSFVCPHKRGELQCPARVPMVQSSVVEDWVRAHLGNQLAAEARFRELRNRGSLDLTQRLDELRQRRESALREEAEKLASLSAILDQVQLGLVAAELRKARRDLDESIKRVEDAVREEKNSSPPSLECLHGSRLKALLREVVGWIAITPTGVVLKTTSSQFMAGRFTMLRVSNTTEARRLVQEPRPLDAYEAVIWFPSLEAFLRGRELIEARDLEQDQWLFSEAILREPERLTTT